MRPLLSQRNEPTAGVVRPREFIRTHRLGQSGAHSVRLCVDSCPDEIALDPDEDRPEIEASECLLLRTPISPPMAVAFSTALTEAVSRS